MSTKFTLVKKTDTIYLIPYETDKATKGLTLKFEYKDIPISFYKTICDFLTKNSSISKCGYIISNKEPESYKSIETYMCFPDDSTPLMIKYILY
jgi:hypothetical protein